MSTDIVLKGIIKFPNLFEARQINGRGKPKYSAILILDPGTDWNALNATIQEALAEKFDRGLPQHWAYPVQDATEDGFPGQGLIKAYSNEEYPPQVVDQHLNKVLDKGAIFGGCLVNAYIRFYGYDESGNRGVGCGLNAVQIIDNVNVTRLDNRKDAAQVFQAIPGAPVQTAPTAYSQPQQQGFQPPNQGQAPAYTGPDPTGGQPPPQQGFQPPGPGQAPVPPGAPQGQGQGQAYPPGYPSGPPTQPPGQPAGGYQPPVQAPAGNPTQGPHPWEQ